MTAEDPRALLIDARRRHRAGDMAAALAGYRQVLASFPRHPEVLQLAAMAAAQSGDLETAERFARRAVDVRGDDAARLTLGRILIQTGALEEALSCLSWIRDETKLGADAAFHAGQALRRLERPEEAERMLEKAVRLAPGHAPAWNELGVVRLERGVPEQAVSCFDRSLERRSGHAPTLTNLATARFHLGDFEGCAQAVARALEASPDHAAAEALLGRLRKSEGRLDEAREIWQSLVDREPEDADAWHGLASTLQAAGELEAAGRAHETAMRLDPGRADLVAARAEWLEWQGRYHDGLEALAALGAHERSRPGPILVRARLQRRIGDIAAARTLLEEGVQAAAGDAPLRRQYCFSLGDVCDELGDYESAWRWYDEGNRLTPASYDGEAHRRWLRAIEDRCHATATGDTGSGVVFILGMPRSGTSLIEQILASHPAVHPAGELSTLGEAAQSMLAATDGPPDAVLRCGHSYLSALPVTEDGQRIVSDKMPTNFAYLPLIHAALPGARVIHSRRDPRDAGLSCFFTDFIDPTLAFATRLDWTCDYIRAYQALVIRWIPRFGEQALEIDYELLVRQPEIQVRRILDFLSLEWDERCLRFHEQRRVVATASHAQVREPIHTRSIGRWRRYRAYLGPLLQLGPFDQSTSA